LPGLPVRSVHDTFFFFSGGKIPTYVIVTLIQHVFPHVRYRT
jgi:hypothetical protein